MATWLEDPFDPHAIAALRTTAYQKATFTKYLDVLIAWGDDLFRRDTIESLNEATQLYVLAGKLLGERPDQLPAREPHDALTFEDLLERIDEDSERLLAAENLLFPSTTFASATGASTANVLTSAYFGIPPNDRLLEYWDVVEDRLFKIRHCMNIEGVVRQLPLFEPPIDPGLLVRARAAGLDLASALSDLYAPLPHVRFSSMLHKAYALNQTVRSLGQTLLSVLEKRDAEALANLRADQEVAVLDAVRQVKQQAIDEAEAALAAAERARESVRARLDHYESLDELIPEEDEQLAQLKKAHTWTMLSHGAGALAASLALVPEGEAGTSGVSSPVITVSFGGWNLGMSGQLGRDVLSLVAAHHSQKATLAGLSAGHERRKEDWELQKATAKQDLAAAEKQVAAAGIRLAIAETDLAVHERQREHAKTVRAFMEDKYTNQALYEWMLGQLSTLYFRSYQLAYDVAKRAERAYAWELGRDDQTFVQFGYWDSLKKGLLAGDRLQHDLERMDAAWLDQHRREYELTKHVSLALLDPAALVQLRTTGKCSFALNEALFDLDFPGQYFRRLRSVAVTIPSVTGPYTGAPARLTLSGSRIRVSTTDPVSYDTTLETEAVRVLAGASESIAISGGQADAGLFGTEREDRYLPFENHGAVSEWNLELSSAVPTFDRASIADVVLTIRYTAREGGETLRASAMAALSGWYTGANAARVFSAKHDFPTEWNAFAHAAGATLELPFTADHFPWFTRDHAVKTGDVTLIAVRADPTDTASVAITATAPDGGVNTDAMSPGVFGDHPSKTVAAASGDPGTWQLAATSPTDVPAEWLDDLLVIVSYTATLPTA